jgi:uncharacterized linocin/CFP29 family protein
MTPSSFLLREDAPFTDEQWEAIDRTAIERARQTLVGRRVVPVEGPFGAGVLAVPDDRLDGTVRGHVDLLGQTEDAVVIQRRAMLPLALIYKDFWLHWRDIEANLRFGTPLPAGMIAAAASACAQAEDNLIFNGDPEIGTPGLLTVPERQTIPLGDWGRVGQGFEDVVEGMRVLTEEGFTGPYALALSPRLYAQLNRVFANTGVLEIEQVEKLVRHGVYRSAVIAEPGAVLLETGAQNADLAIGLDLSVAFIESTNMNHRLRVVESVALRIKRAAAICTFEPGTRPARAGTRREATP